MIPLLLFCDEMVLSFFLFLLFLPKTASRRRAICTPASGFSLFFIIAHF